MCHHETETLCPHWASECILLSILPPLTHLAQDDAMFAFLILISSI